VTLAEKLEYSLVRSTAPNIDSVEGAFVNGQVLIEWASDSLSTVDTVPQGITSYYYYNVLVRDSSLNTAAYSMTSLRIPFAYIYFVNTNSVSRILTDGSDSKMLVDHYWGTPFDLTVDYVGNAIYWTDTTTPRIRRSSLDGYSVTDLIEFVSELVPYGITLDTTPGLLYWMTYGPNGTGHLSRANLDGTDITNLVDGLENPQSIELDVENDHIYWSDHWHDIGLNKDVGTISRCSMDGSGVEVLIRGERNQGIPYAMTLDLENNKIYWSEGAPPSIKRANLDGSGVEVLIAEGIEEPLAIMLDASGGKLYWSEYIKNSIFRANLDMTYKEIVLSNWSMITGMRLVVTGSIIPN